MKRLLCMAMVTLATWRHAWAGAAPDLAGNVSTLAMAQAAEIKGRMFNPERLEGVRSVSATVELYIFDPSKTGGAILGPVPPPRGLTVTGQERLSAELGKALAATGLKVNDPQFPVDALLTVSVIQIEVSSLSGSSYVVLAQAQRNLNFEGVFSDAVPVLVWEAEPTVAADAAGIRANLGKVALEFATHCSSGRKKIMPYSHVRDLR